jgi:hypothetical protein
MTAPPHNSPVSLDLTREETWAVHAAVATEIDRLVDADEDPTDAVDLLRTIEADEPFESAELDYLQEILRTRVESDAPPEDRTIAQRVLSQIESSA